MPFYRLDARDARTDLACGQLRRDGIGSRPMPGAWKTWVRDVDEFSIRRVRLGRKLGNDCFRVLGERVPDFVKCAADAADANNSKVRLFAIQGAALVIRSCSRPFAHLPDFPCVSEANIRELENIFGWRWAAQR